MCNLSFSSFAFYAFLRSFVISLRLLQLFSFNHPFHLLEGLVRLQSSTGPCVSTAKRFPPNTEIEDSEISKDALTLSMKIKQLVSSDFQSPKSGGAGPS